MVPGGVFYKLCLLYRPEDTHKGQSASVGADMNLLYWGGGKCEVGADCVCGGCVVECGEDIPGDKDEWFLERSDKFYFFEAYDSSSKCFVDPPPEARASSRRKVRERRGLGLGLALSGHLLFREKERGREKVRR